uniref:hypothetical protein n=1 Tax=Saccharothrix mutabilis TaxID=33921 RepID=UPI0031D6C16B
MTAQETTRPPITERAREHARTIPNSWLQVFDPVVERVVGAVSEAVIGRYLVDARGEITDTYVENPRYQGPGNELEGAMFLVGAGSIPLEEALLAVLGAELVLPLDPARRDRPHLVLREEPGVRVVDAFTSDRVAPADWPQHWQRRTGAELAVVFDRADERFELRLCGPAGVRLTVPGDELARALHATVL